MKFIVDKMPNNAYECPFFEHGTCNSQIANRTTSRSCPLFTTFGHDKADSCKADCLLLREKSEQIEARWKREEIDSKETYDSGDDFSYVYIVRYTCSNCLEKQKINTRYCPVCGAKMGGAI